MKKKGKIIENPIYVRTTRAIKTKTRGLFKYLNILRVCIDMNDMGKSENNLAKMRSCDRATL